MKYKCLIKALGKWLLIASLLGIASYALCLCLFGSLSYLGQSTQDSRNMLFDRYLSAILKVQIPILLLYIIIYLFLLFLSDGFLKGLNTVFRRHEKHPVASRIVLCLVFNILIMLQGISLYPALFEEHFYQAGGLFKAIELIAVNLGPVWLLPIYLYIPLFFLYLWQNRNKSTLIKLTFIAFILISGIEVFNKMSIKVFKPNPMPNLLILACDSLRGDRITEETTPSIMDLAKKGVFIRDFRICLARTETSWTTLLSGYNPMQHGIRQMFPSSLEINNPYPSIIRELREKGYETYVVGNYCADNFSIIDLGFEHRDIPVVDIRNLLSVRSLEIQPLLIFFLTLPYMDSLFGAMRIEPMYINAGGVTRRLINMLNKEDRSKPFAALAFYPCTHFPYAVPYPYYLKNKGYKGIHRFSKQDLLEEGANPTMDDIRQVRILYDSAVSIFDQEVKQVISYLGSRQGLDNTVIIIMGDHGEDLYEDGHTMGHGDHLLGLSNYTPLIISGYGIKAMEKPVNARLRDIDLEPTLADLFNTRKMGSGISFLSLLKEGKLSDDRAMYYETGLWFTNNSSAFWQKYRLWYPSITEICEPDISGHITLKPEYRRIFISSKHRALETNKGKLIYMPTLFNTYWVFYPTGVNENRIDYPEYKSTIEGMKRDFIDFIEANGEKWVNGRIVPSAIEGGCLEAKSLLDSLNLPYIYVLRLTSSKDEKETIHYKGRLRLGNGVLPIRGNTFSDEVREIDIDISLNAGESKEIAFASINEPCMMSLSLKANGEAITPVDLFTGELNLRPFATLDSMDINANKPYLMSYLNYRRETSIWLGCMRLIDYIKK